MRSLLDAVAARANARQSSLDDDLSEALRGYPQDRAASLLYLYWKTDLGFTRSKIYCLQASPGITEEECLLSRHIYCLIDGFTTPSKEENPVRGSGLFVRDN